jgi:hypothetical protein
MDEKTAAARKVFESGFKSEALLRSRLDGEYRISWVQQQWEGFLACYQHLAPMVEDAERYRWLRNPNHDIEPVIDQKHEDATIDGMPAVIYEYRSGEELDKAIDAAREQEKKTC